MSCRQMAVSAALLQPRGAREDWPFLSAIRFIVLFPQLLGSPLLISIQALNCKTMNPLQFYMRKVQHQKTETHWLWLSEFLGSNNTLAAVCSDQALTGSGKRTNWNIYIYINIPGPFPSPHGKAGLVSNTQAGKACTGMSVHSLCR